MPEKNEKNSWRLVRGVSPVDGKVLLSAIGRLLLTALDYSVPADVRSASSLTTFRRMLKTHLFRQSYTQTLCYNYVAVVLEITLT